MAIRRAKLSKEEARASEFSARSSAATKFSNSTKRVRRSWHIPTHGREASKLENAELYLGCRTPDEDITAAFVDKPRRTVACVTRAAPPPGGFAGRVTKAIASLTFDPTKTDFYVCGSAAMVDNCQDLLTRAGAVRVLTELY